MDSPNIKKELKELILKCLDANYMSESCKDGIKTLNHYQSVALGEIQTTGVRTDRSKFLNQIHLQDKRILDLGSNLGEVSRAARVRGACLVDGFEYDQYFVEIANLINAYNGTTRVSFYQRDITDSVVYDKHYDVVLAFSVFIYIQPVLRQIASITDQLLVLETHKLEDNLDSYYLKPVLQYFPYYKILGESEWMADHGDSGKRAIIAFAKEESAMASAFKASLVNSEAPRKNSAVISREKQGPNS